MHPCHDEGGVFAGLVFAHSAGPVHEREFVGVDVEVDERLAGGRVGGGCLEQLALGPDRDVLARTHRQGAGEEARDAREQHHRGGHPGRADAEHEREVGDEPVVRAEHGCPERARQAPAPACGERADHLAVDPLVGRHGRRGVGFARIRRTRLGALRERKYEDRAESPREGAEQSSAHVGTRHARVVAAEEGEPVGLVAALGGGECQQDLALLTLSPGGELAIDRRLRAFIGEVPAPSRPVGGAVGAQLVVAHPAPHLIGSRGRSSGRPRSVTSLPPARPSATISAGRGPIGRSAGIGSFSDRRTLRGQREAAGAVTKSISSSTRPSSAGSRSP